MAVILKIAKSAKEIDDVFKLRHQSYVIEDGKFGGSALPGMRISDRFDALPVIANIIAYDGQTPVGTLRANLDSSCGLPSEEYFDFSHYREVVSQNFADKKEEVLIASGGMFAILEGWKNRRNIIYALLKLIIGVYHSWGVTHVIATSNHETVSIYKHLGFEELAEPVWVEEIGNSIVPMAASFDKMYQWAFGKLLDTQLDDFWLQNFAEHFERVLLEPGEILFEEGSGASHAYIIDEGWVTISRKDPEGSELTLATLPRGELFGELALLDEGVRSGTTRAVNHTELIRFSRDEFLLCIKSNHKLVRKLLKSFSQRVRHADELAMVMAFAPQTGRIKHALNSLKNSAVPDRKRKNTKVVKMGPTEIAKSAGVREDEVRRVLEEEKLKGHIDYGKKIIRFYD